MSVFAALLMMGSLAALISAWFDYCSLERRGMITALWISALFAALAWIDLVLL